MCSRQITKSRHESVKSLLRMCLEHIISNVDAYSNTLQFLPIHIKGKILKRLTLSVHHTNLKQMYKMLVHSQLKQMDYSLTDVDDEFLNIISCCHNLRELILTCTNNTLLTSTGLIEVMPNFKKMLVLQTSNCAAITDEVIKVIVENSQDLSGLDISGCNNITDLSLKELAKLKKLLALNMCRTNITNDGIHLLVEGLSGPIIRELRIAECRNVTHKAINGICEKCVDLEIFIFYNCSQANDETRINFESENLKKMKQVTWTIPW